MPLHSPARTPMPHMDRYYRRRSPYSHRAAYKSRYTRAYPKKTLKVKPGKAFQAPKAGALLDAQKQSICAEILGDLIKRELKRRLKLSKTAKSKED